MLAGAAALVCQLRPSSDVKCTCVALNNWGRLLQSRGAGASQLDLEDVKRDVLLLAGFLVVRAEISALDDVEKGAIRTDLQREYVGVVVGYRQVWVGSEFVRQ